jgi:hypothetical protein
MGRLKSDYNTKYYVDYIFRRFNKSHGLTYPQISKIISLYHELAREDFTKGEPVFLKEKLGNLQLYKEKREIYVNEKGEIVNELPINLRETFKLWKEKPELKNKTYIRYTNKHSDGFMFTTSYQISKANYKYKNVYKFQFNSTLKKMLRDNIMKGEVDAFIKKY